MEPRQTYKNSDAQAFKILHTKIEDEFFTRCRQWFDRHGVNVLNLEMSVLWRHGCMDAWYLSKITWKLPHDGWRTGEEKMSEIRVVSGELAFRPHVETNHLLLLLIIVLYPKMRTVYRIWEMVSFELGEEIEKDVFRLVISVGQRENLSLFLYWFQNLPCLLFYLPNDMSTILCQNGTRWYIYCGAR